MSYEEHAPDTVTSAERKGYRAVLYEAPRNAVIVRLAEEGVPCGAIARSLDLAFTDVNGLLQEAVDQGQLLLVPAADWPPGQNRDHRAPLAPSLTGHNEGPLAASFCVLFDLTPAESRALVKLVKQSHVSKEALHNAMAMNGTASSHIKTTDVVLCHMRKKLKAHGITISTVRAFGYRLNRVSRSIIKNALADHHTIGRTLQESVSNGHGAQQDGEGAEVPTSPRPFVTSPISCTCTRSKLFCRKHGVLA